MARAKIISFLQMKGGSGKSTLCANVAATLGDRQRVLLIDTDHPQYSLGNWFALREDDNRTSNMVLVTARTPAMLQKAIRDNVGKYDFILVDGHPRITGLTRVAMMLSDLVLVPLSPSPVEVWATGEIAELAKAAMAKRKDLLVRICWNRFRIRTHSAPEVAREAVRELGLQDFRIRLGYRVAYLDSFAEGRTVAEWSDMAAKLEIWSLTSSIKRLVAKQGATRLVSPARVDAFVNS